MRTQKLAMWSLVLAAGAAVGVGFATGQTVPVQAGAATGSGVTDDPYAACPLEVKVVATIRDFRGAGETGGHPDFESFGSPMPTMELVEDRLDAEGKPVMRSTSGKLLGTYWTNAQGEPIMPSLSSGGFNDVSGTITNSNNVQLTSSDAFSQWYRNNPDVNMMKQVELTLHRTPGTSVYTFDSAVDEPYASRGGFFPIDNECFGNFGTFSHNFHFTTEIQADFAYEAGKGHRFKFTGDDDLWVFIDGRLVMDLGGLHPKREQVLELDRLDWLEDGHVYRFSIFHAERHTTASNFRMETTLLFREVEKPEVTNQFD